MRKVCTVKPCGRFVKAYGLCQLHARRLRKHGDPLFVPRPPSLEERFWAKVDRPSLWCCWEWQAALNTKDGYGTFTVDRHHRPAHVVAYELLVSPVPKGLELDHLCRNRICVNPLHLEAVTRRINVLRGSSPCAINAKKSRCPQGHLYDEVNTRVDRHTGWRSCRACKSLYDARRRVTRRDPPTIKLEARLPV